MRPLIPSSMQSSSSSWIVVVILVALVTLSTTTTNFTLAWTTTTTTTTSRRMNTHHTFSRLLLVASTTSSTQLSSFDTYQPGVTNEICWKDDNMNNNNNSINNAYTAKEKDVCVVSYVGKIMSSGFVFNKNDEFVFQIGSGKSMPGFDIGCIGMTDNMIRTIRVPPNKAYGMKGTYDGRVPPNSDLEFVVTMKRLVSYEQNSILAELALFGELRLIGLLGCIGVLALPPFFQ